MTRYVIRYIKRFFRYIGRTIGNSFFRTIGRIFAYLLLALLIYLLAGCSNVHAQTFYGDNIALNNSYYDLFSGYIRNLSYNDNYVAFSYTCYYNNYSSTCYALAYGENLVYSNDTFSGGVNLVKYDYVGSSKQLQVSYDSNFNFSGQFFYSNLGNSSSLEGGGSIYEKALIFLLCLFVSYFICRIVFIY